MHIAGDIIGSRLTKRITKTKDFPIFVADSTIHAMTQCSRVAVADQFAAWEAATSIRSTNSTTAYPFAGYGGTFMALGRPSANGQLLPKKKTLGQRLRHARQPGRLCP